MVHFDAMKRAALFGLEGESKRGRGCFIVDDEARGIMIHKIRAFFQFYHPRKGIIWLSQQKMENIYVRASIYIQFILPSGLGFSRGKVQCDGMRALGV
jgi:hypothetical protein